MAQVTLTQGIEASLREAVPEIGNIIDATDHAAGENPYFASHYTLITVLPIFFLFKKFSSAIEVSSIL